MFKTLSLRCTDFLANQEDNLPNYIVSVFVFWSFEIVSNFEIRISNFMAQGKCGDSTAYL